MQLSSCFFNYFFQNIVDFEHNTVRFEFRFETAVNVSYERRNGKTIRPRVNVKKNNTIVYILRLNGFTPLLSISYNRQTETNNTIRLNDTNDTCVRVRTLQCTKRYRV